MIKAKKRVKLFRELSILGSGRRMMREPRALCFRWCSNKILHGT